MITSLLIVDIGGTHLKFAAIDHGEFRELERHIPTSEIRSTDVVKRLAALIANMSETLFSPPQAVVVTVPGFLHPDRDLVLFAGNVPELKGHRLASELFGLLKLPVFLERDSILTLRGEWEVGAGAGSRNLLGIFFGTGVGSAFLQDGVPFRGAGYALEMGVMPFRREGRTYAGMDTDCLEAYVSGRTLQAIADRHGVDISRVFVEAAGRQDLAAALDEFIADLLIVIDIGMYLFSPDTVLLGGGLCEMADFPRQRIEARLRQYIPSRDAGISMNVRWASLGWKAALHGALHRVNEPAAPEPNGDAPLAGTAGSRQRAET